jgi:LPXTG-motif cell wall-anchored protein
MKTEIFFTVFAAAKDGAETGIASIATIIGIAAVAAVGIFFSVKKRK